MPDGGFFDTDDGSSNICFETNVKITEQALNDLGEDFEKTKNGFTDYILLDDKSFPFVVQEAKREDKDPLKICGLSCQASCRFSGKCAVAPDLFRLFHEDRDGMSNKAQRKRSYSHLIFNRPHFVVSCLFEFAVPKPGEITFDFSTQVEGLLVFRKFI